MDNPHSAKVAFTVQNPNGDAKWAEVLPAFWTKEPGDAALDLARDQLPLPKGRFWRTFCDPACSEPLNSRPNRQVQPPFRRHLIPCEKPACRRPIQTALGQIAIRIGHHQPRLVQAVTANVQTCTGVSFERLLLLQFRACLAGRRRKTCTGVSSERCRPKLRSSSRCENLDRHNDCVISVLPLDHLKKAPEILKILVSA